jgi:signal transduction histidine kinase
MASAAPSTSVSDAPPLAGGDAPAPPDPATAEIEARRQDFLRLVSHELRTPLNSILGFSELLASEIYGPLGAPQYKDYAEIIRGSGKRLLRLVNQVLEIGRLEGLRLKAQSEALAPAVEEAVAALKDEFAARGVSARILRDTAPAQVMADAWGLRTVLGHLIQNAVTFAPDGGEVRLRIQPAGAFVDLFVEDDGDGVDPAELPRLFRPFEQGENALVRRTEGAGLGLTIADLTCRAMGASLRVAAAPGAGWSARVRLRAA